MKLFDLIHQTSLAGSRLQRPDGSMPGGHNGPYHDPERPTRNTSHWLITFLKGYEISGDRLLHDAAQRAVAYLLSGSSRPHGKTFWHRTKEGKDSCNGLIGQAWTIEGLLQAATTLNMPKLIGVCEDVFLLHPFDDTHALWHRVEVDGTILSFDMTFNHQLWFAASGALLAANRSASADTQVRSFLDKLDEHLDTFSNGLIWHHLVLKEGLTMRAAEYMQRMKHRFKPKSKIRHKSIGYHAFNLYGLALLKRQYPDHAFWQRRRFTRAWHYANSPAFRRSLETNKYGFPYNPPGIEMAFALEVFEGEQKRSAAERWLNEQLRRCFDRETMLMSRGTEDPATHAARIYEATRLPDLTIRLD